MIFCLNPKLIFGWTIINETDRLHSNQIIQISRDVQLITIKIYACYFIVCSKFADYVYSTSDVVAIAIVSAIAVISIRIVISLSVVVTVGMAMRMAAGVATCVSVATCMGVATCMSVGACVGTGVTAWIVVCVNAGIAIETRASN